MPSGTSAGTYYYLSDGAGSVAALTNSQGIAKDTYTYDPLGAVTTTGSVPNAFTFGGGSYDSQTGFYFTGSGYYDPLTGQAFGCKDKGKKDPGEDNCGEDEAPYDDSYFLITRRFRDCSRIVLNCKPTGSRLKIRIGYLGNGKVRVTVTARAASGHEAWALLGSVTIVTGACVQLGLPQHLKHLNYSTIRTSNVCTAPHTSPGHSQIAWNLQLHECMPVPVGPGAGDFATCSVTSYGGVQFPV